MGTWKGYATLLQEALGIAHDGGSETTRVLAVLNLLGVLVPPPHWTDAGKQGLRRARRQLAELLVRQGVHASQLVEHARELKKRTDSESPRAIPAQILRSLNPKDGDDAQSGMPMGAGGDGLRLADPQQPLAYWDLLSPDEQRDVEQWQAELGAIVAPLVAHVATGSRIATKATEQAVLDRTRQQAVLMDLRDAQARGDAEDIERLVKRAIQLGCANEDILKAARTG